MSVLAVVGIVVAVVGVLAVGACLGLFALYMLAEGFKR